MSQERAIPEAGGSDITRRSEPKAGEPWALIAHKDNHWAGIRAIDEGAKGVGEFVAEFVAHGFSIMTVHSRDEYKTVLAGMKNWHEHPAYKAKKQTKKER